MAPIWAVPGLFSFAMTTLHGELAEGSAVARQERFEPHRCLPNARQMLQLSHQATFEVWVKTRSIWQPWKLCFQQRVSGQKQLIIDNTHHYVASMIIFVAKEQVLFGATA